MRFISAPNALGTSICAKRVSRADADQPSSSSRTGINGDRTVPQTDAVGLHVANGLWDAFEVMLLPLLVKRRLRRLVLFFRSTWQVWRLIVTASPATARERLFGSCGLLSLVLPCGYGDSF